MVRNRFRSVFISDVHLGTPDCKADFLLHFLRSCQCEHLYLVGDIIDLESLAVRPWWHALHTEVIAEFIAMAERGVKVTYIPGNHDASLRGLSGQQISGIDVRLSAQHVTLDGRRFKVSHGDEFDPEGKGTTWLIHLGDHLYRFVCWINRRFNQLRRHLRLRYLPISLLAKTRFARALAYIHRFEQQAAQQARSEQLDGFICGHIHFGAIRRIGGVLYLNDGDWVEHCTALVEHEDGRLELLHWSDRHGALAREQDADRDQAPLPALARSFSGFEPLPRA